MFAIWCLREGKATPKASSSFSFCEAPMRCLQMLANRMLLRTSNHRLDTAGIQLYVQVTLVVRHRDRGAVG
jgi:hypothetical protein